MRWSRTAKKTQAACCVLLRPGGEHGYGGTGVPGDAPDPHPLPEEIAEQYERQHALTQAVQALPPRLRAVVLLRCTDQMSFVEIGQALKMPAMTAKASFYRARPKLAARLMV